MLETQIIEKKQPFQWKKRLWPIPSRIVELDKRQVSTYKGPQGSLTITVEAMRFFL